MDSIDHDTGKKKSPKMSVIPADHSADSDGDSTEPQLRVAAYCRVSTAKSEQMHSFDSQKEYYEEYIKSHANWTYVGIYADAADIIGLNQNPFTEGDDLVLFFLYSH